jgi:putative phosphotransacetylase
MMELEVKRQVTLRMLKEYAAKSSYFVPAAVSNRHIHLSQDALDALFGKGYTLKQFKPLSQPGQFACEEKLTFVGPKSRFDGIRILGPVRPATQVEISLTDSYALGIKPVVRMSGDIKDTPGGKLIGPYGEYDLTCGVIVSQCHLHASKEQAAWYGLKDGDMICVRKRGGRTVVFENVLVRAGDTHSLELHFDTDEANAALINNDDLLELVRSWEI